MAWKSFIKSNHKKKSDADKAMDFIKERNKNLDDNLQNLKEEE
jgi:prefoldin subunit 5